MVHEGDAEQPSQEQLDLQYLHQISKNKVNVYYWLKHNLIEYVKLIYMNYI